MLRRIGNKLVLAALATATMAALPASDAKAFGHRLWGGGSSGGSSGGWGSSGGSYGSSGGSYGSYGSSGGSYGGYGSSGGDTGHRHWRLFHRHANHGSSGGSSGGWGSSGGSSGGYYYGSSGGSSGGWGSSGGSYGSTGHSPVRVESSVPAGTPATGTSHRSAMLNVTVPAEAKVYVNGMATTSLGESRRYVSSGLEPGFNYTYEVRIEVERDGQLVAEEKVVKLKAGETADLAFDPANAEAGQVAKQPARTTLTLVVPEDAKVYLSGNETQSHGKVREFSTTRLTAGQAWEDYSVRVEIERDGQKIVRDATVSLTGGETRQLEIDFAEPQVARAGGPSF